jgi:hypothetical protein
MVADSSLLKWVAKLALSIALVAATCAFQVASASASTVLSENWETGTLHGWSVQDTSGTVDPNNPSWQILNNPQTISVTNPGINPNLVTLPDSGSLPAAYDGTHAVWFGDTTSGTFCGADWNTYSLTPNTTEMKNGCTSREAFSGTLTSPTFSLAGAASATLHFFSWWEIESVDADSFDVMQVEYSTDGGTTWSSPVQLNPVSNPAGAHDQSYSNNGLEASPSWHEYFVDLSPAIGSNTVQVRFTFDTRDSLYNGFRGWLIDNIFVNTPADVGTPTISSVIACTGGQAAPVTIINGSNFVQGSQLLVDGSQVTSSVESSQRIETAALSPGTHTLQVQSPNNGPLSNQFQVNIGSCAFVVSGISPSAGSTSGSTTVTITGTNFTGATGVNFGPNAASSFTVNSDSQITAVSPPGSPGTVDVTVTGPGGTSATSPADQFTYITPGPPTSVTTGPPSVLSSTGAALSGSVNPNGLTTTAHFEYGLDPKYLGGGPLVYTSVTPDQPVGSDFSLHNVFANVSGLVPNALYHVRLVASNAAGTVVGPDMTFMTPQDPPPSSPVLGKSFVASVVSGEVFVQFAGGGAGDSAHAAFQKGAAFVPLTEPRQLPAGTKVDARLGTIKLSAASSTKHGKLQTGTFNGGIWGLSQDRSGLTKGLTTLSLLEGAFNGAPSYSSCKAKAADASPFGAFAALSSSVLQTLRSSAHGKFRTRGRYGAATVRGTAWTMSDRCDGTLVTVQRDTVAVQDFVRHVTVVVRAGHRYLARAPRSRRR